MNEITFEDIHNRYLDLLRDYALLTGDPDYCRCCAAAQLAALFINK